MVVATHTAVAAKVVLVVAPRVDARGRVAASPVVADLRLDARVLAKLLKAASPIQVREQPSDREQSSEAKHLTAVPLAQR